MRTRFFIWRFAALVAPFAISGIVWAADPEFYYYYRGAKRALELDEAQIAVKLTSRSISGSTPTAADAKAFVGRASALGYRADEGVAFRPGGWIKVESKSAVKKLTSGSQATRKEKHGGSAVRIMSSGFSIFSFRISGWPNRPTALLRLIRTSAHLSIVSLLLLLPLRVLSQDLQWTQRMPVPPLDATLVDLVYAHDRIFAADVAWGIWSSVDGLRWERHAVPAAFGPHIRFENGRFFASNSTSVDGVEWVVRKPAEGYKAAFDSRNVTWLGDRYFAASYDLAARKIVFATSIDGINWQTRLGEVDFQPGAIAVGGKTIVIQGQQSDGRAAALVSSDGELWSAYVIHPEPSFKNLAYGNGMFVAVGYDSRQISGGGAIYWSPDGKSWTGFNLDGLWLEKIRFAGGQFVSVGGNGSHHARPVTGTTDIL